MQPKLTERSATAAAALPSPCPAHPLLLTPFLPLPLRLISALEECGQESHKLLLIEAIPSFCLSTPSELRLLLSTFDNQRLLHPALLLPMISTLSDLSLPSSLQPSLHLFITHALTSSPPSSYPALIRATLRSLPSPRHSLPTFALLRRLSLTLDPSSLAVILTCVVEAGQGGEGRGSVGRLLQAVEEGRETLMLDVLLLIGLGGRQGVDGEKAWEVLRGAVELGKLTLRRMKAALAPPYLDVLTPHAAAVAQLCKRLLSSRGERLQEWAAQLLPHVFLALPACQPELRRLLLSACSKSYTSPALAADPAHLADNDERRYLFHRAELASSILLFIACESPHVLRPHHPHVEALLDFPESLYPVVLHRVALCVALLSPADRWLKECRKMLTMGHAPAKKTALIVAAHLMRAGAGGEDERSRVDGLIDYFTRLLDSSVAGAVAEAISEGGYARHDRAGVGVEGAESMFVAEGQWNLACTALDALTFTATHARLSTERLDRALRSILRPALDKLDIISHQVNPIIRHQAHPSAPVQSLTSASSVLPAAQSVTASVPPSVVFAHQLPDSLLSSVEPGSGAAFASPSTSASSPVLLIHSHYLQLSRHGPLSILRLHFLPLLWRCYLTHLALLRRLSSSHHASDADLPAPTSFLCLAFQLPVTSTSSTLPDSPQQLLDLAFCAYLAYSVQVATINHVVGADLISTCPATASLSGPLVTALSSAVHLLELLLACQRRLQAFVDQGEVEGEAAEPLSSAWLSAVSVLHAAVSSLEMPHPTCLLALLNLGLSVAPAQSSEKPLLCCLYDAAYAPATRAVDQTSATFVETGFFSLLHLLLTSLQLLRWERAADGFVTLSSSTFIGAERSVHQWVLTPTRTSTSSSSSSSSSSSPSSSPLSSQPCTLWSHPLDVLTADSPSSIGSALLQSLPTSLDALCTLERANRREYPQLSKQSTPKRPRPSKPSPSLATALTPVLSASSAPDGKDEVEEADDALETPFRRRPRKRLRRMLPASAASPLERSDGVVAAAAASTPVDASAAVVQFIHPDHSSQLMVADCLALLSRSMPSTTASISRGWMMAERTTHSSRTYCCCSVLSHVYELLEAAFERCQRSEELSDARNRKLISPRSLLQRMEPSSSTSHGDLFRRVARQASEHSSSSTVSTQRTCGIASHTLTDSITRLASRRPLPCAVLAMTEPASMAAVSNVVSSGGQRPLECSGQSAVPSAPVRPSSAPPAGDLFAAGSPLSAVQRRAARPARLVGPVHGLPAPAQRGEGVGDRPLLSPSPHPARHGVRRCRPLLLGGHCKEAASLHVTVCAADDVATERRSRR